ncbi:MAG TPA: MFS transporter [Acidimicrobiales bacterium]|jgi:NNP family nitrate/nitrite transporter-like MFS transporter|nr:MFS transporter [Acidimicrobiales bacterium]
MSTAVQPHTTSPGSAPSETPPHRSRRGHWIDNWDPDSDEFWQSGGAKIARRNLVLSIFSDHVAFNIWIIWTIIAVNLANVGIKLSVPELFWLTAVPNLIGSALRLPYTFALPRFGGRMWTAVSGAVLLAPALLLALVVPSGWLARQGHSTQLWMLLGCAATAGIGGANFSSSMTNISFFYPDKRKGLALGLNAAGGNLGVAAAQLFVPLVIIIGIPAAAVKLSTHHVHLAYAGVLYLPLIVVAGVLAWLKMDSLTQAKTDRRAYAAAVKSPQTWIMSVLYIGTFGSFIGYSFALPLVIKNTFPDFLSHHAFIANYLAGLGFVGALVGSLARPLGGWLSDHLGGARVTMASFLGMAVFTASAVAGVNNRSFSLFFSSFMVIFLLSGVGNGSTYRMIPSIFRALGCRQATEPGVDTQDTEMSFKRQAGAAIGLAGAMGAFGGFVIQVVFRQASLHLAVLIKAAKTPAEKLTVASTHLEWAIPALRAFLVGYLVLAAVTWLFYLRKTTANSRIPSLAHASI